MKTKIDRTVVKVLLYLRVSTDEQARENFSLETQRVRCIQRCDEIWGVGGYEAVEITEDESGFYGLSRTGVSRRVRPGWQRAQEMISTGEFTAMVVYRVDRQGRNLRWLLQFYEDVLVPNATTFISVVEGINTDEPAGVKALQVFGMMSEWQREAIATRNKDAAAKRAEEGYFVGQVGYGWKWAPLAETKGKSRRGILPVPEEGQWIRQMAEWYLSGWSLDRVAYRLNTLGVTPPGGSGKWSERAVRRLLRNPLHAGLVKTPAGYAQGEHFENRFYDPELFHRLQEERQGRNRWKTNTSATKRHLLAGIITCTRCAKRLYVAIAQDPYRAYRCRGEATPEGDKCKRIYLNANMVEQAVVSGIQELCESDEMQALAREEAGALLGVEDRSLAAERDHLQQALTRLDKQFRTWADAFTGGTMTEEQFREYNNDLTRRKAEIQERLAEVNGALASRDRREARIEQVSKALKDFPAVWEHLNFDERRQLLQLLIERVSADREGRDMAVRLKLHLLPERQILVPTLSVKKMKFKPPGVAGLTPRQLALLKHIGDGKSRKEIREVWNVSRACVATVVWDVQKHLGMRDLEDAAQLAQPRIREMMQFLPLEGRSPRATMMPAQELPELLRGVLPYVASGATNPEIARLTGLKLSTVVGRRTRLLEFFGVKSAYEMGQKARAMGLL